MPKFREQALQKCSECGRFAVLIGKTKLCFGCWSKKTWEKRQVRKRIKALRRRLKVLK